MYQQGAGVASGIASAAALPFTGFNLVWLLLAAFTLLMAAGAIWRIVPRSQA